MTNDRWRIGELVLKLQCHLLDHPGRELTQAQVQRLLRVDEDTGEALLGLLVQAGVLAHTSAGRYVRPLGLPPRPFGPVRVPAAA